MAYATATVQSSTQPAEDLYNAITSLMSAHAAWQFVEDYLPSATVKHSVWKCLGSVNGSGDFYVVFSRALPASTSVTALYATVCEVYNVSTHSVGKPAPYFGGNVSGNPSTMGAPTTPPDYSFGGTNTFVLPNNANSGAYANYTGTGYGSYAINVVGNTSAFTYFIGVFNDGVICAVGGVGFHVGLCDTLVNPVTNDPMCLGIFPLNRMSSNTNAGNSTIYASMTRHPLANTSINMPWTCDVSGPLVNYSLCQASGSDQVGAAAPSGDLFQQGYVGLRQAVGMNSGSGRASAGGLRALLRHRLQFNTANGLSYGDTVTVGGVTYVGIAAVSGNYWTFMNTADA